LELLHGLFSRAQMLLANHTTNELSYEHEAWSKVWLPILQSLCTLCKDPRLDVRNYAITYLQRSLLSPLLDALSSTLLCDCFLQIIFPLLTDLLKPMNEHEIDVYGLEETRLRASALLSKIFLQYLSKLTRLPNFNELWIKILQFLKMYMEADNSELLAEAVRESLKNVLLVMSASGLFKPNQLETEEGLWTLSWSTINSFCPTLKGEFDEVLSKSPYAETPTPQESTVTLNISIA